MVKPPSISKLLEDTDIIEAKEKSGLENYKDSHQLNSLSQHRASDVSKIPKMFDNITMVSATKKVVPEYG